MKLILTSFLISLFTVTNSVQANMLDGVHIIKTMSVKTIEDHYSAMLSFLEAKGIDVAQLRKNTFNAKADAKNIDKYLGSLTKKPKLLIAMATLASKHLHKYSTKHGIPLMFTTVSAPIEAGLIKAFDTPSNTLVTGVSHTLPMDKIASYIVQMARVKHPKAPIKMGYVHSTYPSEVGVGKKFEEVFAKYPNIEVLKKQVNYQPKAVEKMKREYIEQAVAIKDQVDFFLAPIGPLGFLEGFTKGVVNTGTAMLFCAEQQALKEGAILLISSNEREVGRIAGEKILSILRGNKIGTIPPQKVESVRLGVNIKSARKHGITVPSNILRLSVSNLIK